MKTAVMPRNRSLLLVSLAAAAALLPLAACSNSPWAGSLERSLAADPRLQSSPDAAASPGARPTASAQLPTNFPGEIPRYPNAELVQVNAAQRNSSSSPEQVATTRWTTSDRPDQVKQFYQQQFQTKGWTVATPDPQTLKAEQDGLSVTLTLGAGVTATPGKTDFSIAYQLSSGGDATNAASPGGAASPGASPSAQASAVPKPGDPDFIGPILPSNLTAQQPSSSPGTPQTFGDISQAPADLQPYLSDLAKLGVLQGRSSDQFQPNATVTRREFARWLVAANNQIYGSDPARKIRLGSASDQPAFQDVRSSDPDFGAIQGLANAGVVPSPLSGASTTVTFRPDAPLTREDLLLWKVPVDLRRVLPNATVEAVQQTWGFQDAAQINPQSLRAVLADFQNGDHANIRRAFGYTTLFQPKKPVTRAEAAAALWYFGYQGDGLSAKDALQGKSLPTAASNTSPSPSASPGVSPNASPTASPTPAVQGP